MLLKILQMIKNGVISSCDIASLYPYVMTKKLPIGNHRFIKYFNRNRYLNSDYSCLLNCEIYSTDEVKNNSILKQFPALISKTSIKYVDLSEFQRKNVKENYKSSEKLITLGYKIVIKKILEYRHSNFMKPYIDFLFEKNLIIEK